MAVSALKSYLEASKRETRLVGPLEKYLLTRPPDTSRRTDVFHPSEIVKSDWCHRASYLAVVENQKPKPQRHNLRTENIFAEGHAIHAKWQNWIADMGNLYGKWKCPECHGEIWGVSSDLPECEIAECGWPDAVQYREVPLRDDELHIAGHCDGWVVGLKDDFIIEIKSVGVGTLRFEAPHLLQKSNNDAEAAWNSIRSPFKTHFLQGQMYLYLLNSMFDKGFIDRAAPSECVFLYEWKANQDYKEFSVKYSPDYLTDILDNCKAILAMAEAPECNISPEKGGCKKCLAYEEEE